MDDPGGDGEFALHALGIAAELAVCRLGQVEGFQKLPRPVLPPALAHAVKGRAEAEIVEAGQLRIEIAFVRNHADQVLGRLGISRAVDPADPHRPGVRPGQPGEDVDGGGFARPVGSEKTEQFALGHVEAQIRDGLDFAESLGQPLHDYGPGRVTIQQNTAHFSSFVETQGWSFSSP